LQGYAEYQQTGHHSHPAVPHLYIVAEIRAVMKPLVEDDLVTDVQDLVTNYCNERGYVSYCCFLLTD
jgi:hypothetical protein